MLQNAVRSGRPVPTRNAAHDHDRIRLRVRERTVGSAWLLTKQGDAFLADLRIEEEFRGQGYGAAAMKRLEGHLKKKGYPAFRLHVYAQNAAARALYDKLGFEVVSLQMRKTL